MSSQEQSWVNKKMAHGMTVAQTYYQARSVCGVAAKAVSAMNIANKKADEKQKMIKKKLSRFTSRKK